MFIADYGIRLIHLIVFIHLYKYGITLTLSADSTLAPNFCTNVLIQNVSFGVIHSLNFYSGQAQPPNVSCSWIINNSQTTKWTNYIFSLRVIEVENDPTHWSNELTFWTGARLMSLDDIIKRTYVITTSSSVQIFFRTKPPLLQTYNPYIRTNLRIRRFLIEFIHVRNDITRNTNENNFRCLANEISIPLQWKCNCIYECTYEDFSDEDNCRLCSMYEPSTSLLCHANEFWCLPPNTMKSNNDSLIQIDYDESDEWMQAHVNYSRNVDPKGVCIPHGQYQECLYSTRVSKCEKTLTWKDDHGQILINNFILDDYEILCFIVIAKTEHKIKLFINHDEFTDLRLDFDVTIYDGTEEQNQILISPDWLLNRETVQTRQHHLATIIVRKRPIESISSVVDDNSVLGYIDTTARIQRRDTNSVLLNITWITSVCPDDQYLCGGHFETKCYTKQQRCDGIWDCISGDDELGCSPESCPTTFACNDNLRLPSDQPRCFTWSERCNGNAFCANRTDEKLCSDWWCNSNNGTFLCKNLNCIYETWVCDGTDDCGDHSDETNCPSRLPRRIVTAAVIGATICSTLFIIALGCTCKLFHLRTAERRATHRLLNPQQYIEQRRQEIQREQERRFIRQNRHHVPVLPVAATTFVDNPVDMLHEVRRIAPPSYNQTMGLVDENEERQAALVEQLRLAGLANYISLPTTNTTGTRTSRSTSRRRHRRHRRHRHHHHRRAHSEGSRVALLEPSIVVSNNAFPTPSTSLSSNRFQRFRYQLSTLFSTNRSNVTRDRNTNNSIQQHLSSNHFDIDEHEHPTVNYAQTITFSTRPNVNSDFIQPRELPPPYVEEQNALSNSTISNSRRSSGAGSDMESTNSISSSYRIRKRQIPANTLRDRMRQFISTSTVRTTTDEHNHSLQPNTTTTASDNMSFDQPPPTASVEDDEQQSNDDNKMLTP